ncbi:MAG: hypothetical protein KDK66_05195 [Deltaproteobacteria bacterium]|nr:hypothetical protein [Deltaproteobacteria bacterium]
MKLLRKSSLIVLALSFLFSSSLGASSEEDTLEKAQQLIMQRMTRELNLNGEESQQMEEIFKAHREKRNQLRAEMLQLREAMKTAREKDDKDALQAHFKRLRQNEEEQRGLRQQLLKEVQLVLKDEERQADFVLLMGELNSEVQQARKIRQEQDVRRVKALQKLQN